MHMCQRSKILILTSGTSKESYWWLMGQKKETVQGVFSTKHKDVLSVLQSDCQNQSTNRGLVDRMDNRRQYRNKQQRKGNIILLMLNIHCENSSLIFPFDSKVHKKFVFPCSTYFYKFLSLMFSSWCRSDQWFANNIPVIYFY